MAKTNRTLVAEPTDISEVPAAAAVQTTLQRVLEGASVNAAYGQPIKHGQRLFIPAAEIFATAGMGVGTGGSAAAEAEPASSGSGGGGGAWVFARPVAMLVLGPDGVHQEPVVDLTKIALAALTAAGFMASMALRMLRGRRG